MITRRLAVVAAGGMAAAALIAAPAASGAAHPAVGGALLPTVIGHLAYVTNANEIDVVQVSSDGSTSGSTQVGPVASTGWKAQIEPDTLIASGDGRWLAWAEQMTKSTGQKQHFRQVLVLRKDATGVTTHWISAQFPVGFAGHQLVTTSARSVQRVKLSPTPHFVQVHAPTYPLATYSGGVVLAPVQFSKHSNAHTDSLELKAFGGHITPLHTYRLAATNYRDVDRGWVSGDGKHLLVERGNHQDFGGLGPSSLADEFSLIGSHARSTLGHYGAAKAQWRLQSVAFAGPSDSVWAAWAAATATGVRAVVADYADGKWQTANAKAVAVAADAAGDVVVQPGKYIPVKNDPADQHIPLAQSAALLTHAGATVSMIGIEGTAFAWVTG